MASAKPQRAQPPVPAWIEALPLAAMVFNAQHHMLHYNQAAEPFMAHTLWRQFAPLLAAITRACQQASSSHLREVPVGGGMTSNAWIGGVDAGNALVLLDTTERLDTSQFTTLSSTMAAMLAHEIRNPLLSIRGAAQLLQGNAALEDVALCELITKEVDRIDQLIATLDPLSATPPPAMVSMNIHEPLEHSRIASQASHPSVTFVLDYDPSLPPVMGSRDGLVQLFLNLLKNACEAVESTAQPTVTIRSRYTVGEARRNEAGVSLPIAVSITDNGSGIAAALREQLFAPFTTTKPHGKGLGLAVVARIAQEHGGMVVPEPMPEGGGARFTLYLPIA